MKDKQNLFEQKSKGALVRIFLSSFLVITFFYIAPIFINFADKNFNLKEYSNNSQKILAYTLNKKDKNENEVLKEEEYVLVYSSFENYGQIQRELENQGINIISSEFERIPKQFKNLDDEKKEEVNILIENIEEDDDVQNVFHNMN